MTNKLAQHVSQDKTKIMRMREPVTVQNTVLQGVGKLTPLAAVKQKTPTWMTILSTKREKQQSFDR